LFQLQSKQSTESDRQYQTAHFIMITNPKSTNIFLTYPYKYRKAANWNNEIYFGKLSWNISSMSEESSEKTNFSIDFTEIYTVNRKVFSTQVFSISAIRGNINLSEFTDMCFSLFPKAKRRSNLHGEKIKATIVSFHVTTTDVSIV